MKFGIQLFALLFILFLFILVTYYVKKNKISIKYSIVWYSCLFVLTLFTIFPNVLGFVTKFFGIQVSSNFIFAFMIGVLFIITMSLTIIVSEQQEKIKMLIQEISILKESNKK
ncbi:MAG: DUF2304 domain-containing protein [Bacilli bacterium]|nr:DUF2304 domain-containing protein [Bacilli bacterium]